MCTSRGLDSRASNSASSFHQAVSNRRSDLRLQNTRRLTQCHRRETNGYASELRQANGQEDPTDEIDVSIFVGPPDELVIASHPKNHGRTYLCVLIEGALPFAILDKTAR